MARVPRRQIYARGDRAHPGGSRLRFRIQIPLATHGSTLCPADGESIRRDCGYPRRRRDCASEKGQGFVHLQRRRLIDPEKIGWRSLYPCGSGDQCREHQGLHDTAYGPLSSGHRLGAAQRQFEPAPGEKTSGGSYASLPLDGRGAQARKRGRVLGAGSHAQPGLSLSRPRDQLSDRPRRGAQIERDFLYPRGRLSRRRNETWPDCSHRRDDARRRALAAGSLFSENVGKS